MIGRLALMGSLAIAAWAGAMPPTRASAASEPTLSAVSFVDQRGAKVSLPDGRVWIVTFFYGTCKTACPQLLHGLSQLPERLPPSERGKVSFAAITFDPTHDTAADLVDLARMHELDGPAVHVMRGSAPDTKAAIEACGFDYQQDPGGGFRHVNLIALIDGQGRVRRHFYGLQPDYPRILAAAHDLEP